MPPIWQCYLWAMFFVFFFSLLYQPLWLIRQKIQIVMNFSGWYMCLSRANLLLLEEWPWWYFIDSVWPYFLVQIEVSWVPMPRRSFSKSSLWKQVYFRDYPFLAPLHCLLSPLLQTPSRRNKTQGNFYPGFQKLKKFSEEPSYKTCVED